MGLAILLFFLGLLLVVLEIFFPSFGVLAVSAAASFVGAIVLAFQEGRIAGFAFLVTTVVVLPFLLRFGFRALPRTPMGKRIVLRRPPGRTGAEPQGAAPSYLGKAGRALSELRPAGAARIEGERVDVVTRGEFVERGREVRVVEHEGNRIVVEAVPGGDARAEERKKPRWA